MEGKPEKGKPEPGLNGGMKNKLEAIKLVLAFAGIIAAVIAFLDARAITLWVWAVIIWWLLTRWEK